MLFTLEHQPSVPLQSEHHNNKENSDNDKEATSPVKETGNRDETLEDKVAYVS
jgi:hypothetical protein